MTASTLTMHQKSINETLVIEAFYQGFFKNTTTFWSVYIYIYMSSVNFTSEK